MQTDGHGDSLFLRECDAAHLDESSETPRWIALNGAGDRAIPLPDPTVLAILSGLAESNLSNRRDALLRLARRDPSWAAWLISISTRRAGLFPDRSIEDEFAELCTATESSNHSVEPALPRRTVGADNTTTWADLGSRVIRLVSDARFAGWLASTVTCVVWNSDQAQRWWDSRRRICAAIQRVLANPWRDGAESAFWWTIILASDSRYASRVPLTESTDGPWEELRQLIWNSSNSAAPKSTDDRPQASNGSRVAPKLAPAGQPSDPSPNVSRLFRVSLQRFQRLDELERQFDERLEQEKLLAMKELAYGASHEINNPLANVSSRAQMLLRDETDPERRRSLATINSQAFRAHEMIADMMLFAKPPALERATMEWAEFCGTVLNSLRESCPESVQLHVESSATRAHVLCDGVQLTSAIRAVWQNAMDAVGGRGSVGWRVDVVEAAPGERNDYWAELEITDSGSGISDEVRRHLFDPFYSGREAGRGLGFGLSKAWRIVQLHGGQLCVGANADESTSFVFRLPVLVGPRPETSSADLL